MDTNQQIQNALDALNANPMFHMSLASKELFHSNFLYWLWKLDASNFRKLLDELSECDDFGKLTPDSIEVKREYQHFDLCVVEKDKPHNVLLVIENKVKSIPYVEQLNQYSDKLPENCKKILLTLMQDFLGRDKVEDSSDWTIKNYYDLANAIENSYIETKHQIFVNEYIKFIRNLHVLSTSWNPDSVLITQQEFYKDIKDLRLHDLFGKLFYSQVAAKLKEKLNEEIDEKELSNISVSSSYSDRGGPLFDVTIRNLIDTETEFIIQVQGECYRHAVARPNISYADLCIEMNTNDAVQKMWWPDGYFIKKKRNGNLGYNKFDLKNVKGCFIHKYIKLVDSESCKVAEGTVNAKINNLIDYIVKEVEYIYTWKKDMQSKSLFPPYL